MSRSWAEISLPRLTHNIENIRAHLQTSTDIIAVVKANAYGHGVAGVAHRLYRDGIRNFTVATLEEAIELRQFVPNSSILVLGGCPEGDERTFLEYDLTASVFDERVPPAPVKIEVKIDTGLNRLGIPWQEAPAFLKKIGGRVQGVFSHFAASGTNRAFSELQLQRFLEATSGAKCRRHISDSAGLRYPESHLDAVRIGLALYGIPPCPEIDYVLPVLSWKTVIFSLRDVPGGESVGYGRTFVAKRDSRVGVLPVGYADGYNRLLSNAGAVRVRSRLAPIAGRISMDLTAVDLTDIPEAEPGEEVALLENEVDSPLSAHQVARKLQTIPYEVLTSIGQRVQRVYVNEQ
ncbi:MAG: alanine racemase [Acidobacteria bacterium]|nr:alanine racemase [Acidobacteriota bacterium]